MVVHVPAIKPTTDESNISVSHIDYSGFGNTKYKARIIFTFFWSLP